MPKKIILIKLGGAVITNKDKAMSLRQSSLSRLVKEVIKAQKKLPNTQIIVGHGHGSFGHVPMQKYQTTKGFDMTGGMKHKIEESLELAKSNLKSYIISGLIKNNLYNCLLNKKFVGTIIS